VLLLSSLNPILPLLLLPPLLLSASPPAAASSPSASPLLLLLLLDASDIAADTATPTLMTLSA
jgi:hypothetical protein